MINMELQPTYSGYAQPQSNLHQPATPPRHQPLKLHFDDTLCPICKFRTETPMQIHYGGQACFSCRAFFRDVHICKAHKKLGTKKKIHEMRINLTEFYWMSS